MISVLKPLFLSQSKPTVFIKEFFEHAVKSYLLTSWSRVLLEKLTGSAASQEIPPHFWNPKFRHRINKCPPPVPILNQLHPVPTTPSHFLETHLKITLSSMSGSPHGLFPSGYSEIYLWHIHSFMSMFQEMHRHCREQKHQ